jgi:hypothetical protein
MKRWLRSGPGKKRTTKLDTEALEERLSALRGCPKYADTIHLRDR